MPRNESEISTWIEKGGRELLTMDIVRSDKVEVRFRIAPEIEHFFQRNSSGKKMNSKWLLSDGTNATFWEWNSESVDELANEFISSYLNNYGGKFFDTEGKANVGILRTVGASDGITILFDGMMTKETLEEFAQQVRDFVIKLYKQFIRKVVIKVNISIEEVV